MRYKVGAEQLEQVPSMVRRPNGVFRSARITPVGPTHAVAAASDAAAADAAACGIPARRLHLLDQDWEASFIESALPASTPSLPTAKCRCGLASSRLPARPPAGHPGPALEDDVDSQHRSLP